MIGYLVTAAAVFTGVMGAIIVAYCVILLSRREVRRSISVFSSSVLTLSGVNLLVIALNSQSSGMLLISSLFMAIIGGVWLVCDMAWATDRAAL